MLQAETFIDYYAILEVSPACSDTTLDAAFRELAKRYHPDHPGTADVVKFNQVIDAHRALRHPEERAAYDQLYAEIVLGVQPGETGSGGAGADRFEALGDAAAHARILSALYRRRRENAQDAGVAVYFLQQDLQCSDETMQFHVWYLKEKGFVVRTESGELAITIAGVDEVIARSRSSAADQLLLAAATGAGT